jgi:hypothetical protein
VTTAAAKFVSFGSPLQQAVSPKVDGGPQATATGHRWTRRPQTADDLHVAVVHRKTLATIAESADHHHITITIQLYGQIDSRTPCKAASAIPNQ